MKILINLIIVAIIVGGAIYFYEQNRDELNATLDSVKNASVESVTEAVVEKVKQMDPQTLMDLAKENKEQIAEFMDKNDIKLENMDVDSLKQSLEDSGISLEGIDLDDIDIQEKLKEIIESAQK